MGNGCGFCDERLTDSTMAVAAHGCHAIVNVLARTSGFVENNKFKIFARHDIAVPMNCIVY